MERIDDVDSYRDNLSAAHIRIKELEQQIKPEHISPPSPKPKKPKGYWWGLWGKGKYSDDGLTPPTCVSLLLGVVLIWIATATLCNRHDQSEKIIREQMCKIMKHNPNAVFVRVQEVNARILRCEYFVPYKNNVPAHGTTLETLDPSYYME
jgi:hypothetical protein